MPEQSKKSIIVLAGLPLSGKSSTGEQLSKLTGIPFLDVDDARQHISSGNAWLGPEREKEIMLAAYSLNHQKAMEYLRAGKSVIFGATFSRPAYHQMLRDLADKAKASLKVFLLQIPDKVVLERLEKRKEQKTKSNIKTLDSYHEVKDRYVAYPGAIAIDSYGSIKTTLEIIINTLE